MNSKYMLVVFGAFLFATSFSVVADEPLPDTWSKAGFKCEWHKSWNGPFSGVALLAAPACNDQESKARRCIGIIECSKNGKTYLSIANCPIVGSTKCSDRDPHECIRNGSSEDHLLFNDKETKYFEDLAKATEERRKVSEAHKDSINR